MSDRSFHPEDLLPWYANGTLAGEERVQVERHIESCEQCRQELALMRALRLSVKQDRSANTPGELGLRRLLRDVKAGGGAARAWWRPALAAAAVVIVAQALVLAALLWPREQSITPLGSRVGTEAATLQVRFAPTATEAEIRSAINDINGVFIDGPGALGVYRVRLVGVAATDAAEMDKALQRLRARRHIVQQVTTE
jgi:anti-sigma factor RsiW